MAITQHSSRAELTDYCQLCHELRVKQARLPPAILARVRALVLQSGEVVEYLGINFKSK